VVCVTLAVGLGYLFAGRAVNRAERAWAERGEPMEPFVGRYPQQPDSPAGIELDKLTRPLGIQMCGVRAKDTPEIKKQAEVLQSLGRVLSDCGHAASDACAALPRELEAFLAVEARRLEAIETHILGGGPLLWAQDVHKGMAAPIPHLLGHRQLQNVLLTRVLWLAGQGQRDAAERSLEASWVLNASFTERPDLLSRLIAVAVSGMQTGVLRTLKQPAPAWRPRMQRRAFAEGIRVPFQLEAWNWTRYTKGQWGVFDVSYMEDGVTPPSTLTGTIGRALTTPYVRLSCAGMSEALLSATETFRAQKRCDFDVEAYSKEFEDSFPRWNIIGRIATPSVIRAFTSMRYADLDRELTERVLAARAARQATGSWPSAAAPSTVCEGVVWQSSAGGDGSLTIAANAEPFSKPDPNKRWSMRLRP
jgi:hypothetical protein